MIKHRKKAAGFTLIELLFVLTISSIILFIITNMLTLFTRHHLAEFSHQQKLINTAYALIDINASTVIQNLSPTPSPIISYKNYPNYTDAIGLGTSIHVILPHQQHERPKYNLGNNQGPKQ